MQDVPKHFLKQILFSLVIILCSSIFFNVLLGYTKAAGELSWDIAISHLIYQLRSPFLTAIMEIVTALGDSFILITGILITLYLAWKKKKREALIFVSVLLIGLGCNLLLKELIERPRPDMNPLILLQSYSFPSGHAMNSFIFYTYLAYFIYHFTRKKTPTVVATLMAGAVILLIGFSRVYLGVHYPSDILAGYFAGAIVFFSIFMLTKIILLIQMQKKQKGHAKNQRS